MSDCGTGGALRFAYEQGVLAESFLVIYGDSFLPVRRPAPEMSYIDYGLLAFS